MIMTSSPVLTPHSRSIAHTPSPSSSPILRPVASTMAKHQSPSASGISTSLPTRSFVRRPEPRPYDSGFGPSARKFGGRGTPKPIDDETKRFAELVVRMVGERAAEKRKTEVIEMIEHVKLDDLAENDDHVHLMPPRRGHSIAGSLASSWETERAELIVDFPAWTPGCFQDLSTLHTLRDTTLSHTHALLGFMLNTHSTPASYKLLARSAVSAQSPNPSPFHHGWGCIRLAPSVSSPMATSHELTPEVRRASLVHTHSSPAAHFRSGLGLGPDHKGHPHVAHPDHCHLPESPVVLDSDDEEENETPVKLREGWGSWGGSGSGSDSDDEEEEESADSIVAREIQRRGNKEGMVFLMTLFGQPALILT